MADRKPDAHGCPCACTNVTIMQLFHELKQKFPAVPDRVINECIQKNGHQNHDKEACVSALEKENRAYLLHCYPPGLPAKMNTNRQCSASTSAEVGESYVAANCHCLHLDDPLSSDRALPFERHVPGRQSLDSLCRRQQNLTMLEDSALFKQHHSDGHLHLQQCHMSSERGPSHFAVETDPRRVPPVSLPFGHSNQNTCPFIRHQLHKCACCCTDFDFATNEHMNTCGRHRLRTCESHDGECELKCTERCEHLCEEPYLRELSEPCGDNRFSENIKSEGPLSDVKLEFASDIKSCRCFKRTSVSLLSSTRRIPPHVGPHSAPVTPSGCRPPPVFPPLSLDVTTQRHRTALSVEPAPPYSAHVESQSQRPFTKVNLTLRPPSSDPQPPIDIRSTTGGGLTYTTCSYDPRQGFKSRLQICIGPGSQGSVSAVRKGVNSSVSGIQSCVVPDMTTVSDGIAEPPLLSFDLNQLDPNTQAVVCKQLEQKQRLEKELQTEKERLRIMRQKVADMEQDLRNRTDRNSITSRHNKVQYLRDEILNLRAECKAMTAEVDLSSVNPVPLGETSEDFYRDIYRGPDLDNNSSQSLTDQVPEPRRASDLNLEIGPIPRHTGVDEGSMTNAVGGVGAGGDGPNWTCYVCTFRNHPLLDKCEQCEMPRIVLGTSNGPNGGLSLTEPQQQLSVDNQLGNNSGSKSLPPNFVH